MRKELREFPELLAQVDAAPEMHEELVQSAIEIQQIAAPTDAEGERAAWVQQQLRALSLSDVVQDELCNVYARLPGSGKGPALLISAHTDTVFPAGTDLTLRRDDAHHRLLAPGLGDNSLGVATLLLLARMLGGLALPVDVWFVANSGEEGLGDLRGMRAVFDRLDKKIGAAIVLEGMGLGRIVHQALGSRRYRITVDAPGGHSWSAFGAPSAVHTLVQLAERLTRIEVPAHPRTTWNIGRIGGGTSINTIAEHASLELDLRSEQGAALQTLIGQVQGVVSRYQSSAWRHKGVNVTLEQIGDRPTGDIPASHPLVRAAERALLAAGVAVESGDSMSSTDANIPLNRSVPAVCVGVTRGGNAHRLDEWISTLEITQGIQHLLLLAGWATLWLAGETARR